MNGLTILDPKDPNLLHRFLARRPRENAYIEVQNILASTPVDEISPAFIRERLELHGVDLHLRRGSGRRSISAMSHLLVPSAFGTRYAMRTGTVPPFVGRRGGTPAVPEGDGFLQVLRLDVRHRCETFLAPAANNPCVIARR